MYEGKQVNIMCPATLPAKPEDPDKPNCPKEIGGKNARYEEIQKFIRFAACCSDSITFYSLRQRNCRRSHRQN